MAAVIYMGRGTGSNDPGCHTIPGLDGTTTKCSIVLVLTVLLMLTLDYSGALHVYGLGDLMGQRLALAVSLVLMLLAAAFVLVAFFNPPHQDNLSHQAHIVYNTALRQRLLALLLVQAWFASLSNLLHFIVPVVHPVLAVVLTAITLVLIVACVVPCTHLWSLSMRWVLLVAVAAGILVRLVGMAYVPIDPARDDMLPLVVAALDNFIAGQSPYTLYHMPWELPLTYLPITWLAYGPTYLINLDIRLTNLLAELGVGGLLAWRAFHIRHKRQDVIARKGAKTQRPDKYSESCRTSAPIQHSFVPDGLLLWAWFFVQPTAINWTLATTIPIFWLLLCMVLVLLLAPYAGENVSRNERNERKDWTAGQLDGLDRDDVIGYGRTPYQVLAAVVCGLCLAASPLTSLLLPFVVLERWRTQGWAGVARFVGIAGLVAALCIIPFLVWAPQDFVLGVWRWFNDNTLYPQMRWDMDHTWARQIGVSGVFWRHGWVWLLKPIQAVLILSLAGLFWLAGAWRRQVPLFVVAAVVLFVVFNPVLWPYLYTPAVVAALVVGMSGEPNEMPSVF